MKTMTCKQLGGVCDQKLSAESWNEMVGLMVKHVTASHPDLAKQMEQMHNQDPQRWGERPSPSGKPLRKTSSSLGSDSTQLYEERGEALAVDIAKGRSSSLIDDPFRHLGIMTGSGEKIPGVERSGLLRYLLRFVASGSALSP